MVLKRSALIDELWEADMSGDGLVQRAFPEDKAAMLSSRSMTLRIPRIQLKFAPKRMTLESPIHRFSAS
jgi:hypothetical protein